MDNKAVFVKTSKGEEESSGKTANLYSAIKRVLLMVDGVASFGEISKRSAPSMRASLDEMFKELEKGGYIQDKAKTGNFPKMAVPPKMAIPSKMAVPPKMSIPSRMAVPPRMAVPHKEAPPADKPAEAAGGELDFMDEFFALTPAQILAEAAKDEKRKPEDEARSKQQNDAAAIKAQQEAAAILRKAEQEAAEISAREEQARRAKEEAEAVRKKAAQEAEQLYSELEANRKKAEQEARARAAAADQEHLEAAAMAQQQAEAERLKAAQEEVEAHEAAERIARIEREAAKARLEEELRAQQRAEAERAKAAREAALAKEAAERIAKLEREAAAAREETEKLARQRASEQQSKKTTGSVPATNPAPEIKLDPFFVFDPFKIQTPPPAAPQEKHVSAIEHEPEIKLDASIFETPKAAIPPPAEPSNTVQANQAAEARQPVESKPGREQVKQTEEQRIAAEAQAKKLAEAQSRAEVEQRAAAAAKARSELSFQRTLPPTSKFNYEAQKDKVSKVGRKPFPWGKLAMFMLVLLAGALYVIPFVLPMRDYMPKVQQMLSERLKQPVHVGLMAARILPTPRLELGEIYVGDVKQLQVQQAQLNFSVLGLFGDTKPIDSIEMQGVKVSGAGLQSASAWLQQLAADKEYPIRRMVISQGVLDADAIQFTGIDSELMFNEAGKFTHADLRANDGNIKLTIDATPEGRPQVAITMYTSALPLLPRWSFDELTAKGELSSGGLKISDFDGRMLGGMLQGDANIDWRSGWRAQGTVVAKTITMQNLSQGLTGDMDGSARFQMQATSLSRLAETAMLNGTFIVKKGVINGIDIVETARSRSKESVPGGRTNFDELSGVVTVAKDNYAIRQMKMDAGELIVTGTLDIAKKQLSGRISADLSKWAGMGKVTMQVGGTTDNPSLRGAP